MHGMLTRNEPNNMITIANYSPFDGEQCETNRSGNLLIHAGLELSEPMLYGIS